MIDVWIDAFIIWTRSFTLCCVHTHFLNNIDYSKNVTVINAFAEKTMTTENARIFHVCFYAAEA